MTIAIRMFFGGSGGRSPESFWKNTNQGNLIPACRKTPAEAAVKDSHTISSCPFAAAWEIKDLEINPEVRGKDEIDSAPMVPHTIVNGMVLKRPPRSVHLRLPVAYRTEPALINNKALYMMWVKA